jgi:hypothetical protein
VTVNASVNHSLYSHQTSLSVIYRQYSVSQVSAQHNTQTIKLAQMPTIELPRNKHCFNIMYAYKASKGLA